MPPISGLILAASSSATRGRRSFHLLSLQLVIECGFLDRNFILKSRWVNEGIWPAWFELGEFLGHVVHGGMRSEWHVHVSGMQGLETLPILFDELRISDQVGSRVNTDAANEQDVVRPADLELSLSKSCNLGYVPECDELSKSRCLI